MQLACYASYLLFSAVCRFCLPHGHFPAPRPSADSRDALSFSFLSFLSPAAKEQREQQQLQLNSPLLLLIVVSVCLFGPSCQS